jgi:hypothetical protein
VEMPKPTEEEKDFELAGIEGSGPYGPAERPMGGYLTLPATFGEADAAAWVERACECAGTLPPKVKKKK